MQIAWKIFVSFSIPFCVSIKFVSSVIYVPACHETEVFCNYLDAPTFHNLLLSFPVKTTCSIQVARESDWSLLNHNQTLILFGRYRNEPWTDHKLQYFSQEFLKESKNTKFFHINCQSIVQKKEQTQVISSGL